MGCHKTLKIYDTTFLNMDFQSKLIRERNYVSIDPIHRIPASRLILSENDSNFPEFFCQRRSKVLGKNLK